MLSLFPLNNIWLWCLNTIMVWTQKKSEEEFHRTTLKKSCHSSSFSFTWFPLPTHNPLETMGTWSFIWDFVRSCWAAKICKSYTNGNGTCTGHLYSSSALRVMYLRLWASEAAAVNSVYLSKKVKIQFLQHSAVMQVISFVQKRQSSPMYSTEKEVNLILAI